MNHIRHNALLETFFVTLKTNGTSTYGIQHIGKMIWRKIDENTMSRLNSQLNSRNHVTISRNDNRNIAILLKSICYNLGSNTHIRFLFLESPYLIATIPTSNFLLQILT